jgi:hypothetical protein
MESYWWHKKHANEKCHRVPELSCWNHTFEKSKRISSVQQHLNMMDKVEQYQTYIQELMEDYVKIGGSFDDKVEAELIFDTLRHRYQLVNVGWHNEHRIYECVLHIDIKDGKIWIQYDGTETGIASKLSAKGIPKQDIVLGCHSQQESKL